MKPVDFMIYIIPLIIMIICVIIAALIIIPKTHLLANIELEKLPSEKNARLKTMLLEKKLERKAMSFLGIVKRFFLPLGQGIKFFFSRFYEKIHALEKKYEQEAWKIKLGKEKENTLKINDLTAELFTEAESLIKGEDLLEAEKRYIKILSLDPKNVKAYVDLGRLYLQMREYDQAREVYEHVLSINKDYIEAYRGLGELAAIKGEWQGASENYQKSVELDVGNARYYAELARAYHELGKLDLELETLKKAVELEPNNPKYLDLLLETSIISNNKKLASATFKKLQKANPENQKLEEFNKRIEELNK